MNRAPAQGVTGVAIMPEDSASQLYDRPDSGYGAGGGNARFGWESGFPSFESKDSRVIRDALRRFIPDATPEQIRAWDDSIPKLQLEFREAIARDARAHGYSSILEYELPMESRRPDVVILAGGAVVVLELKGKSWPSQADLDQASAYARDLRCYHRECADRPVHAVVVPTRARGDLGSRDGVQILGPDRLDTFVCNKARECLSPTLEPVRFLSADAYRPLPSLVRAARELFTGGSLRTIHRARAATDPAVNRITQVTHEAAQTRTRHLVLVTGVPGAGKTLVGLRTVHAHFLDDLAVVRPDGTPTAPAVFLSGNAPLVEVLQYELRGAGGDGKTFVRGVKEYVKRYSSRPGLVPPQHVLVFDEAQRAHDPDRVREVHGETAGDGGGKSEPAHFIEFAGRIPQWSVVLGLIGLGQEIHVGEEAGLGQWRDAVEQCQESSSWRIHGPPELAALFAGSTVPYEPDPALNLTTEIRFHSAKDLHRFVDRLLGGGTVDELRPISRELETQGYHLRITRSLEVARAYLQDRYAGNPEARFGLIASSKDKDLEQFGVPNGFQATKRLRFGPWYGDGGGSERSCRQLTDAITEFGAQGLELDAALLAWGTDFRKSGGVWNNDRAGKYRPSSNVRDPFQLRRNSYRVLLTRGRDATVVFVPPMAIMDETHQFLVDAGFKTLADPPEE
jgi:Uncharacterized conserved protein (DUF2075)